MTTLLNAIEEKLQTYRETHEQMHSDYLTFTFEIVPHIYLEIGIGKLTDYVASVPNQLVVFEAYESLPMQLKYRAERKFSPWQPIKLKELYEATIHNDASPFEFLFDAALKPYECVEKIGTVIKGSPEIQQVIKKLSEK